MSPDDQPDLDPVLADAVRRAYVRPVDEVTSGRHLSAIVAAAGALPPPLARPTRERRRVWPAAVAAAAATLLLPAGLAVAGVSLPAAVREPYRAIGITLPQQARHAQPAPSTGPVLPRTAPATPPTTSRQTHEQRETPSQAGRGQRDRNKPQTTGVDRAGPKEKPRKLGTGPRQRGGGANSRRGPRRPPGLQSRPASPKPGAAPKARKSTRQPTSPRTYKGG